MDSEDECTPNMFLVDFLLTPVHGITIGNEIESIRLVNRFYIIIVNNSPEDTEWVDRRESREKGVMSYRVQILGSNNITLKFKFRNLISCSASHACSWRLFAAKWFPSIIAFLSYLLFRPSMKYRNTPWVFICIHWPSHLRWARRDTVNKSKTNFRIQCQKADRPPFSLLISFWIKKIGYRKRRSWNHCQAVILSSFSKYAISWPGML